MADSGEHQDGDRAGRREADERLIAELAAGRSIRDAAELLGLSARTIYRRLRSPRFRRRLEEVKRGMTDQAVSVIERNLTAASDTLVGLLKSPSEAVRLNAAKAMFDIYRGQADRRLEGDVYSLVDDLLRVQDQAKGAR